MTYTEHYITSLLNKLEQPHMVFDNKIFIIPTSSPMFELLPQQKCKHMEFKTNKYYNYTWLIIDLDTYEIDPVKDTYEYINEQKELI